MGINPAMESKVTTISRGIVKGEYLREGMTRPILIGDRLAVNLKAEVGDKVVLLVQAADGSIAMVPGCCASVFPTPRAWSWLRISPTGSRSTSYRLIPGSGN